MNKKQPKLKFEEDKERTATRSPPKKEKVEQTQPRKKLKLDADKAAEKAQHLRFGKAEITPDEASRMTKAQKREMYASAIARSAAHREVDQYEDDNVGTQALNEGLKTEECQPAFFRMEECGQALRLWHILLLNLTHLLRVVGSLDMNFRLLRCL